MLTGRQPAAGSRPARWWAPGSRWLLGLPAPLPWVSLPWWLRTRAATPVREWAGGRAAVDWWQRGCWTRPPPAVATTGRAGRRSA